MKNFKYSFSWILVFIITFSICIYFSAVAINKVYKYLILNEKTYAVDKKFEIKNKNDDYFYVVLSFEYEAFNKKYSKNVSLKGKFLNQFSAKEFIDKSSNKKLLIFFNKKNPNIFSIEKKFPYKNCIYAFITIGILIYFLILKAYISRIEKN
ncbi:MAG: hypothetical protein JXA94_06605 [Parachlamydiales bacterium]|nr:hypothetical protein [Parachlamydiales bacterium]